MIMTKKLPPKENPIFKNRQHRPHEAQEEGRPKCGFIDPSSKVDQNTHASQPTNRMSIGSPMEEVDKEPKELKGFAAP